MRIKAKLLLPRKELDALGNEIDPRQELIDKILEYKKYKEAARKSQKIEEKRLGGKNTRSLDTDEGYIELARGECCPFCGQTRGDI